MGIQPRLGKRLEKGGFSTLQWQVPGQFQNYFGRIWPFTGDDVSFGGFQVVWTFHPFPGSFPPFLLTLLGVGKISLRPGSRSCALVFPGGTRVPVLFVTHCAVFFAFVFPVVTRLLGSF